MRGTPEERFWAKVEKSHGCWLWIGARSSRYGRFRVGDFRWRAHRFSWVLAYGPIPEGLHVLHRCDNPPCVRPSHLWLGTHSENIRDSYAKGRGSRLRGEANSQAKLTWAEAGEIRSRYEAGGISQAFLAREYGVTQRVVWNIVHGKSWKEN